MKQAPRAEAAFWFLTPLRISLTFAWIAICGAGIADWLVSRAPHTYSFHFAFGKDLLELEMRSFEGSMRSILANASPIKTRDGKLEGAVMALLDVTESSRYTQQAMHDALTGLPNRVLFMDRLEQERAAEPQKRYRRFGPPDVGMCPVDPQLAKASSLGTSTR